MKSSNYARIFADVVRSHDPKANDVSLSREDREMEIELIRQAMSRRKKRVNVYVGASAGAAAALLVIAGLGWRAQGGEAARLSHVDSSPEAKGQPVTTPIAIAIASGNGAIVAAPGSSTPAVAGRTLTAGSRLIVDPNKGAKLALSTGTRLDVQPGSQLGVVEDGRTQIFALSAGSLQAEVAKLRPDERFLVRTTDAEVEVRGTSFVVDVVPPDADCGGGATTRVNVSEGVVVVRSQGREDALHAGESWPRGCRKVALATGTAPHVAPKRGNRSDPGNASATPAAPNAESPVAAQGAATPSSTLAEENNLFAEGALARRNGQLALALGKMDRLLEVYPSGHLAENAAAERMRILRTLDPARAHLAARQYLRQYPAGFARADAESILAGSR